MRNKTFAAIFAALAIVSYTLAVLHFSEGNVLSGFADVLLACTDALFACVFFSLTHGKFIIVVKVPNGLLNKPDESAPQNEKEAHVVRMAKEYDELAIRIEKLSNFLDTDDFKQLPEERQKLMGDQLKHMTDYMTTLKKRIELECADTKPTAEQ